MPLEEPGALNPRESESLDGDWSGFCPALLVGCFLSASLFSFPAALSYGFGWMSGALVLLFLTFHPPGLVDDIGFVFGDFLFFLLSV